MRPIVALFLMLCTGCAAAPESPAYREDVALDSRVDELLGAYARAQNFSGVVIISRHDTVLVHRAYGLTGEDVDWGPASRTLYPIASVTKTFTGAAIALLAREGKLAISDSLAGYLPEYPEAAGVTLDQLLRHTSGLPTVDDADVFLQGVTPLELVRRMRQRPMEFAPGTGDSYNSQGYTLLALVIERVSGMPYHAFVRERLLRPSGMRATGHLSDLSGDSILSGYQAGIPGEPPAPLARNEVPDLGGGSMYSSADDLLRWLVAIEKNQVIPLDSFPYPYGWGRRTYEGRELIEQTGMLEGFNSYIALYRDEGIRVVVLSNVQSGLFNRIGPELARVLFGGELSQPPTVVAAPLDTVQLRQFAGTYTNPEFPLPMLLAVEDGRLTLQWGSYPFTRRLVPTGEDTFFYPSEYASITFERDSTLLVQRSIWRWGDGDPVSFVRVNE